MQFFLRPRIVDHHLRQLQTSLSSSIPTFPVPMRILPIFENTGKKHSFKKEGKRYQEKKEKEKGDNVYKAINSTKRIRYRRSTELYYSIAGVFHLTDCGG